MSSQDARSVDSLFPMAGPDFAPTNAWLVTNVNRSVCTMVTATNISV